MNIKKLRGWVIFLFALVPVGVTLWAIKKVCLIVEDFAKFVFDIVEFVFEKIVDRYYDPLVDIKEVYDRLKNENEK